MFIYHCNKCHHEVQIIALPEKLECGWCGADMRVIGEDTTFEEFLEIHYNYTCPSEGC